MLKRVIRFLTENGFEKVKSASRIKKDSYNSQVKDRLQSLSFKHLYLNNDETEMYIICESKEVFTEEQIKEFEKEISGFIILLGNRPIAYNINLLLLCPLNLKKSPLLANSPISKLIDYERSRYFCRKIFLDTANRNFEEELEILPSFPLTIEVDTSSLNYEDITKQIQEDISPDLYRELISKDEVPNIESVLGILEKMPIDNKGGRYE